jgi:hypothetical protein
MSVQSVQELFAHGRQNSDRPPHGGVGIGTGASETKSSDQRWFGPCGSVIGARVPSARFRPPRRRTLSPSSR